MPSTRLAAVRQISATSAFTYPSAYEPDPQVPVALIWSSLIVQAVPVRGAEVTASFTSATTVPVTAASYTATGNTVDISLGFVPPVGTSLTVVNNTGQSFIQGTFDNLAQGQTVDLTYAGTTHRFVANYFGGTGNDLVLQWAFSRLMAWGRNTSGQYGNNSSISSYVPARIDQSGGLAGKTVSAIAAGESHTLVLCSDGTLAAWGYNSYGQLGNNTTTTSRVPVLVTQTGVLADKSVVSIGTGNHHSLALCADGSMAAWGYDNYG